MRMRMVPMRLVVLLPLLTLVACGGGSSDNGDSASEAPESFRLALSLSPFSQLILDQGVHFEGVGDLEALQALYQEHGATEVFARVSTRANSPQTPGVDRSLSGGQERAGIAALLSLPLNVELSLFRSYGDVLCQTPPDFSDYAEIEVPADPWHSLDIDQMTDLLRQYTKLAAESLLATGVEVEIWNLGNEVEFGTAGVAPQPVPGACDGDEGNTNWYQPPDAINPAIGEQSVANLMAALSVEDRIEWLEAELWPHTARLLAAAAEGVREVDPEARFSTHISASYLPEFAEAFYAAMFEHDFEPDQLGLSFYPSAANEAISATQRVQALRETVEVLHTRFERPVFIAEFAYPAEVPDGGPFADWDHAVDGYPLTEAGQADLARDLASWAAANGVAGIRPWAPDLVDFGWEAFALFEREEADSARGRAALSAFVEGLQSPDADALP